MNGHLKPDFTAIGKTIGVLVTDKKRVPRQGIVGQHLVDEEWEY
jgi:hypothetical protein